MRPLKTILKLLGFPKDPPREPSLAWAWHFEWTDDCGRDKVLNGKCFGLECHATAYPDGTYLWTVSINDSAVLRCGLSSALDQYRAMEAIERQITEATGGFVADMRAAVDKHFPVDMPLPAETKP